MRPLKLTRVLIAPLALAAFASCSDDARDAITTDVENAADEVEEAARTAVTEVEDAAGEVGRDAAEAAARNIATEQGEEEFANAKRPLEGKLKCEATANDAMDAVDISCTGTTQEGEKATMEGTTSEVPGASVSELEGTFTGTIAGEQVFEVDTLGG
ncbi:MAG: hypothetical protein H0V69_06995 [Acidimicrobiia bacterium]|nr:hypothetical protein [Acidimicrobiia bacterium]